MTPEAPVMVETPSKVEAFVRRKIEQIKEMYNRLTSQEFRDEFNKIQPKADTTLSLEMNKKYPEGEVDDVTTPSEKNQVIETITWTKEVITSLQSDDTKAATFINTLPVNAASKQVLLGIVESIEPAIISNAGGSSYVYEVLNKAMNGAIDKPLEALYSEDFATLAKLNPELHKQLEESLITAARKVGVREEDVQKFRLNRRNDRESRRARDTEYVDGQMMETFNDGSEASQKALEFYEASASPQEFQKYYHNEVKKIEGTVDKDTGQIITKEIAERIISENIQKTIRYMVYTIYAAPLDEAPVQDFSKTVAKFNKGIYGGSPDTLYTQGLTVRLEALSRAAQQTNKEEAGSDAFYSYGRKKISRYNIERGVIEEVDYPTAELIPVDFIKALRSYKEIAESEKSAYEYQYNFRYLMQLTHDPQKSGSLFANIANYAKSISTDTIDYIHMQNGDLIQAATMALTTNYMRVFQAYKWKKVSELFTDVLEPLPNAEKKTIEQLEESFKGKYNNWEIQRAFQHARLNSFGKEFYFQLMASYADPNTTDTGKATYLGEGKFARNSAFDIFESFKRWQGGDPEMYGLPYMPLGATIEHFDSEALLEEGKKRFFNSFTEGMMAYFGHDVFEDHPPMAAYHNLSKTYGTDGQGGFRIVYPMLQWLDRVVDRGTIKIELEKQKNNPNAFVEGWKSIENIGIQNASVYAETFILAAENEGDFLKNMRSNKQHYENFARYLYRRYLNSNIGQSLITDSPSHVMSEEQYIQNLKKEVIENSSVSEEDAQAKFREIVQDSLTIMLYERMPLKLLYMEKERSSQNGVTLSRELQDHFLTSEYGVGGKARWADEARDDKQVHDLFNDALDDLQHVEQTARIESIERMRESLKKYNTLYGDPNQDLLNTDVINYKVDEPYLIATLTSKYITESMSDADRQTAEERISRAVSVYQEMNIRLRQKPRDSEKEIKWKNSSSAEDRKLYQRFQERKRARFAWFKDEWVNGNFGMTFTDDIAGEFMNRASTGEELISRGAEAVQYMAEPQKDYFAGPYFGHLKAAQQGGKEKWGDLVDGIKEVYGTMKSWDVDGAKLALRNFTDMSILFMRRDDVSQNELVRFGQTLQRGKFGEKKKYTSVGARSVGQGAPNDWKYEDIYDFVSNFADPNSLNEFTSKKKIKYKEVVDDSLGGMIKSVLTGKEATKKVRDFSSEISAEGVRAQHKADEDRNLERYIVPAVGVLAIAILLILLKEAFEEETGD